MSRASHHDLAAYHTFGLSLQANQLQCIDSLQAMQAALKATPKALVIGDGSNVVFCEDYLQPILVNRIKGWTQRSDQHYDYFHVEGGESWPEFVETLVLTHQIGGLENLALIPGRVGSAPIQNIGAYGIEFAEICNYVDYIDRQTGEVQRLGAAACEFAYRDSIFKHALKDRAVIVAVGLKLPKQWQPKVEYAPLKVALADQIISPQSIFQAVVTIRQSKLPDPEKIGNAGSFFKNPIVSRELAQKLKAEYPAMPTYAVNSNQKKLAAGWLIDQCQLKGFRIGGAQVHPQQALVLANVAQATPKDVIQLAKHVMHSVQQQFDIQLEPEVRFIGSTGEIAFAEAAKHV